MSNSETVVTQELACRRLIADRDGLLAADHAERAGELVVVHGGPSSTELRTVIDVYAHVGMWDEIVLAVVLDARRGRIHWSLDSRWEAAAVGRALNGCGLHNGRLLPADLVRQRFCSSRDTLIDTLASLPPSDWDAPLAAPPRERHPQTLGGLCQYVSTPEGDPAGVTPYLHAMAHLEPSATSLETLRMVAS